MRKYKPQKFGLNPEWVELRITKPGLKIIICALVIYAIITNVSNYASNKALEREEQKIIQESISAEESIIAESKRAKAEAIAEEKAKQESLAKIEVEVRKVNALYEDKITKKAIEGKKYWRNNKTMKVGKVERIYGLEVITNNDWSFMIDKVDGSVPKEVVNIGYAEYARTLKKQKETEEKKNQKANASKIQKLIDDEIKAQTEITKSKFGKFTHFKLGKKYYRVMKIVGTEVICLEHKKRDKKSNYERIEYSDRMQPIDYISYELEK